MLIGIGIFAVLVAVIAVMMKKKGKSMNDDSKSVPPSGVPDGHEQEYTYGLNPEDCEIPVLYTLHTCRHCVHLKDMLNANGVTYLEVYVDDFWDPARKKLMEALRGYNPRGSFPTLVLPNGKSVVGFREAQVKELLHIE